MTKLLPACVCLLATSAAAQFERVSEPQERPRDESTIEAIEFRGARRMPQDALRRTIFTQKGDKLDEDALHRDFMALWNTGRFDDIRLETEPGRTGTIVRFVLTERQVVRSIRYDGMKSITVSEILDRFKERKVGLSVESQYDPNKVQRARVALQEYLAERGRQFATVEPVLRKLPPSSLELTFRVNEGPKVKVGKLDIEGNSVFGDRAVRRAMKNLRPVGVPYSILFENIFAKTYDSSKLEDDKESIRQFYQTRGYFSARALEQKVVLRDTGGGKFRVPLFYPNKPGKRADVTVPVEEGRKYHVGTIRFSGVKLFRTPEAILPRVFQMSEGDTFSTLKFHKGLEGMRKLYGDFGYIDFVPEPSVEPVPGTDKVDITIAADEGRQFFVRRIDISGNTTTRDKVIRRELLIDEGDLYRTGMWEMSLLRLNQLGYFEPLKAETATEVRRDTQKNTVDLALRVKERGKNTVGMNGGTSGIAGSFVGFNYSTNNFLGLGETLSIDSQLGDRIRSVTLGFTEPYFRDKPLQLGFTVFMQRFNYEEGREFSLLAGRNYNDYFRGLGPENLTNYVSNSRGFTVFTSYPLRRSFARLGLSYQYSISTYEPLTEAARAAFWYMNYQGLNGPNQLAGVRTSMIVPSYTYNSTDHPFSPTRGHSLSISAGIAGPGGNVNLIQPSLEFRWFRPALRKGHVLAMRFQASHVSGYGGKVAPPFNRWRIGGEQDVRGFENWGVSPIAFIPSQAAVPVLNNDGTPRLQKVLNPDGTTKMDKVSQPIPSYQYISAGGDTQAVSNIEYRIPIVGPVTLAAFFDAGMNKLFRPDQLMITPERLGALNSAFPQAGFRQQAYVAPGTQKIRTSTGLELQVVLPVVNAPFRLYWAYNPTTVQQWLQPPEVADRTMFPNNATFKAFQESKILFGQAVPLFEPRRTFRFTIGKTF